MTILHPLCARLRRRVRLRDCNGRPPRPFTPLAVYGCQTNAEPTVATTGRPLDVQNQPESTKIDHPNRTNSSAQRFLRRNAPENFFGANHPDAKLTRPRKTVRQAPITVEQDRTGPNTTERPNARSSALSGTSVARRRESLPSRTPDREPHSTPGLPFAGPGTPSNRIEQDRTPPNARTHDLQRSALLPPKDARHSLRPERSELEEATYSEWSS